jgi:hypothetical protein
VAFALGAGAQHGFDMDEGFRRVMSANMQKEVVESADKSKRDYAFDLVKPEGWREPYLQDLLTSGRLYRGVIILEGPDGTGKTTLANHLVDKYGAYYMHATWSPDLETRIESYLLHMLNVAQSIGNNQLVVIDRNWLSELVYTDVFRKDVGREEWHMQMHQTFITLIGGVVIYCLPEDAGKYGKHFSDLKESRDEMYDTIGMANVYYAFTALWEGDDAWYKFKSSHKYVNLVYENGGLKNSPHFVRYDFNTDGKDIDAFMQSIPQNAAGDENV